MDSNNLSNSSYLDRFGDAVTVSQKFIMYRERSFPTSEIKEIRLKSNRLMINHFTTNSTHPKMCIHFESKEKAASFHEVLRMLVY
jgi:hypothetical protein